MAFGWQEVGFSSYQHQLREQESSYLGLNRVSKKRGPRLPIPDSAEASPLLLVIWGGDSGGLERRAAPVKYLLGVRPRQPIIHCSLAPFGLFINTDLSKVTEARGSQLPKDVKIQAEEQRKHSGETELVGQRCAEQQECWWRLAGCPQCTRPTHGYHS